MYCQLLSVCQSHHRTRVRQNLVHTSDQGRSRCYSHVGVGLCELCLLRNRERARCLSPASRLDALSSVQRLLATAGETAGPARLARRGVAGSQLSPCEPDNCSLCSLADGRLRSCGARLHGWTVGRLENDARSDRPLGDGSIVAAQAAAPTQH